MKDFKKGDHIYLIDIYKELDKNIETGTIYWIVNKLYSSKNFNINYKLKDINSDKIIFLNHKSTHLMRKLDIRWVRKIKTKNIRERQKNNKRND
jgi:hypothetical protein